MTNGLDEMLAQLIFSVVQNVQEIGSFETKTIKGQSARLEIVLGPSWVNEPYVSFRFTAVNPDSWPFPAVAL